MQTSGREEIGFCSSRVGWLRDAIHRGTLAELIMGFDSVFSNGLDYVGIDTRAFLKLGLR